METLIPYCAHTPVFSCKLVLSWTVVCRILGKNWFYICILYLLSCQMDELMMLIVENVNH
uniref:Uncharacterized protein n=1 Tax=Arundo donax TaxID=35708 RepID=A0A0A9GQR3_ARUDO